MDRSAARPMVGRRRPRRRDRTAPGGEDRGAVARGSRARTRRGRPAASSATSRWSRSGAVKHADLKGVVSLRAFPDDGSNSLALFIDPIPVGDRQFTDVVVERARQAAAWRVPAVFCPPVVTFKSPRDAKEKNVHEGLVLSVSVTLSPNSRCGRYERCLATRRSSTRPAVSGQTAIPAKLKKSFTSIGV